MRKQNNEKATRFVQVIDGCTGDDAIAERWRQHFQQLYNSPVSKFDVHKKCHEEKR